MGITCKSFGKKKGYLKQVENEVERIKKSIRKTPKNK